MATTFAPTPAAVRRTTTSAASVWWLLQAVTGVLLVVLLGLHMAAQHFAAQGGLRSYADVLSYVANPAIVVLDLAFSSASPSTPCWASERSCSTSRWTGGRRVSSTGLTVLGVLTVVYGVWMAFAIQALLT